MASYTWDKSQLGVIAETAFKKYGTNVEQWSSDNLKNLGRFLSGLPTKVFSKFSDEAFKESLQDFCDASLPTEKKSKLIATAERVFGDKNTWNSTTIGKLCNLIEALTPQEFLILKAKEVEKSLNSLSQRFLTKEQKEVVLKKLKENWGKFSAWSKVNLSKAKDFLEGLDVEDFKELDKDKIKEILDSGRIKFMNKVQQSAFYEEIIKQHGPPEDWPESILSNGLELIQSVSVEDLQKIKAKAKASLIAALEKGQEMDWSRDQAEFLLELVEDEEALATFTKEKVVQFGYLLKAFSQSDAGKISKKVLYAAFPELLVVKGIGEPVLRYFIKVYKEESSKGEIKNLGQFAKALTRYEIEQQDIEDILENLQKLSGTDFDETQAAELLIKIRKELGNMEQSDHTDADILPWGFQNIRKIGQVIVALTRKEALKFPFKGIENTYEELGKHDGWKRRVVLAFVKRMKENWTQQNITLNDLKEVDIEVLGKFVQGLTMDDLNELSDDVQLVAFKQLGKYTGLPEDKLKSRANLAYKYFEKQRSGSLTSNDLQMMGNLLPGLSPDLLNTLDEQNVVEHLQKFAQSTSKEKQEVLLRKLKSHFGQSDVAKWTASQWNKALPLVNKMSSTLELRLMNNEVFQEMLNELGRIKSWSKDQTDVLLNKAKNLFGKDISSWDSKIVHKIGSIFTSLASEDIPKMSKQFFENLNVDVLDGKNFSASLKKLMSKQFLKEFTGDDVTKLTSKMMQRFHFLISGLDVEDLKKLSLTSDDVLETLSSVSDWSEDQLEVLGEKAKPYINSFFNVEERAVFFNQLVKGLPLDDIKKMTTAVFNQAISKVGSMDGLNKDQKQALMGKAKTVWGGVEKWSASQISEAKKIIDGLEPNDVKKITPEYMSFVSSDSITNFSDEQLQALTVDQLTELDDNQISSLTSQQMRAFDAPQAQALQAVQDEDPKDEDPYASSGTRMEVNMMLYFILMCFALFMTWM
uniref:Uncharacterized protein n=2 Tax=Clytia hemisphaerica TaxID=252671 RepID=A0A7M5V9F0_9CNID